MEDELTYLKYRNAVLEAELHALKQALAGSKPAEPDHYIDQDHIQRNHHDRH